jgi:hypothetical protein
MAFWSFYDGLAVSEIFVLRTAPAAALWGTPGERLSVAHRRRDLTIPDDVLDSESGEAPKTSG